MKYNCVSTKYVESSVEHKIFTLRDLGQFEFWRCLVARIIDEFSARIVNCDVRTFEVNLSRLRISYRNFEF